MSRAKSFCGASPRKTLDRLLLVLALILAIRKWVCMPALVLGSSMAPSLHDGQVVLVNKLAYLFGAPARGDIVCIWTGSGFMIKRIIGLPHEEVALHDGRLYVNGRSCFERYIKDPSGLDIAPGRIPANSFAVIGDNRPLSVVATVNRQRIIGKLMPNPRGIAMGSTNLGGRT